MKSNKFRNHHNWPLKNYQNGVWTDLVVDDALINSLIIANTSGGALSVQVRLYNRVANTELAILQPALSMPAGDAQLFDLSGLVVSNNYSLQVQASGAGIHFTATGTI